MSEYIITPTTKQGGNATGDDALDKSQSGHDTPVKEGGTAVPLPNSDSAPSLGAGPIGWMSFRHGRAIFPHQDTCGQPGCLKVFATNFELKKHARSTGHKPYRCECGQGDVNKGALGSHIAYANRAAYKSIVHTQAAFKEPHTCAEEGCHKVCSKGSELQEHAKVTGHKAYRCVCSKSYSKLCSLSRHIDESRDDAGWKYDCPICKPGVWFDAYKVRFKRLTHLQQHLKAEHRRFSPAEVQAILLPFRKRKTRASKPTLTTGPAGEQDAPEAGVSPLRQLNTPVGNTAAARRAFPYATTGAIPPAQDANTTALTVPPAEDLADLAAGPVHFNLGAPVGDLTLDGSNAPFQASHCPNQFGFQPAQRPWPSLIPSNGLSSSHPAHGTASAALANVNLNSYMPSSQYGLITPPIHRLPPWANPFAQPQVYGSMTQYNPWSMTPNFGTFTNQNEPLTAYHPPANPIPQWPASVNYGQMGHVLLNSVDPGITAGQMPMGSMLGCHGALPCNLEYPTSGPVVLDNTEAYAQPLTDLMGYDGLSEDSTAAEADSQVFHGQAD